MTEFRKRRSAAVATGLLVIFAAIHLSYYVSALKTDHLKAFFPKGTIQDQKTLDYYQVPNGARTYFEGGSIIGHRRTFPVLPNVYHPAFTIFAGGILQLWDEATGFRVYAFAKLFATVLLAGLIVWNHRHSEHFLAAAFVFLCFFSQGVEIGTGQYHFLLNACVFLFFLVYSNHDHGYTCLRTSCYLGSLLVKPIGLLWVPALLANRQYRTTFWGLGLFAVLTLIFYIDFESHGDFYVRNILFRMRDYTIVDEPTYTVNWIMTYLNSETISLRMLKYTIGFAVLVYSIAVRPSLFVCIFLWTGYYLLFYIWIFEYHYTSLVPFYVLGLLTQPEFQRPWVRASILFSCFPSPYFLLKSFQVFEGPNDLTPDGEFLIVCWKVFPLVVVILSVCIDSAWKKSQANAPE